MENASKALIIAGGVLIGIITISLFTLMFNNISSFTNEISEDYEAKEVLASNQSFEAYNKKLMYGADVISVLNKAIDNNTKFNVNAGDSSGYSVDVVIKFNSNLEKRVEHYKKNASGIGYEKERADTENIIFTPIASGYSLKNNLSQLKTNLIDPLAAGEGNSVSTYTAGCTSYTVTYYPAAEFKRKIFQCEKIDYSNSTGRVSKITFIEKL